MTQEKKERLKKKKWSSQLPGARFQMEGKKMADRAIGG
jgi:hypothetical protein